MILRRNTVNSDCHIEQEFFDFNKSHDLIISPLSAT